MPLTFVCIEHGDAVDRPSRRHRAIPLTHALHLDTARGTGELFRVSKPQSEEKFHVLDCAEDRLARLLAYTKCLENQQGNRVSDPVVAVVGVNSPNPRWQPCLADDVVKQNLY